MQQKHIKNLILRARIIREIRRWFEENNFIEVETPILVDCPDLSPNLNILKAETTSSPLETRPPNPQRRWRGQGCVKYLIASPEFSMKKILSHIEFKNIFTITKVFRGGEENTGIHSTEFTMLEWYRKNADYKDIMKDTEKLIKYLLCALTPIKFIFPDSIFAESHFSRNFCESASRQSGQAGQDFTALYNVGDGQNFPRLKVSDLFKKHAQIDNVEKLSLPVFKKIVHSRGYSNDKNLNYEQCFNLIFLNEIEPKFPKTAFFLIDYPAPLAALSKIKKGNPLIAERFELFINGIELCNGFSELTDGEEQLARFKKENRERKQIGKPRLPVDYELCGKLNFIGEAGGNALGIDRLVMILLGTGRIDVAMY